MNNVYLCLYSCSRGLELRTSDGYYERECLCGAFFMEGSPVVGMRFLEQCKICLDGQKKPLRLNLIIKIGLWELKTALESILEYGHDESSAKYNNSHCYS